MGMTYKVVALKPNVTVEQYLCDDSVERGESADIIINDMVFDREDAFRAWCGCPAWIPGEEWYAFRVEKHNLEKARAVLQELYDKVSRMPFTTDTKENPAYSEFRGFTPPDHWEYVYHGSPENVAILKEVDKVLDRTHHFGYFPWEDKSAEIGLGGGVKSMIAALDGAIEFMEANPDRTVIGLYY